jgi:hypothetical protein
MLLGLMSKSFKKNKFEYYLKFTKFEEWMISSVNNWFKGFDIDIKYCNKLKI